ncbi:MAG: hypothetical protein GF346_13745 [Candidatus Eisenbacteria bacterium]|nr:hypothetical protein [Candidatus Latescibacterota bacterium]MBD3303504.1 hypothetical protein [Candidatus Eisenbacteria bacterium]
MTFLETIDRRLREAIKARDSRTADVLRMLKTRIMERRTASSFKGEMTDEIALEVTATYVKQLTKSLEDFEKGGEAGRALIEKTQWEIDLLSEYLPKLLDEEQTRAIVDKAIEESGIRDPKQVGRLMGVVMKDHKGSVDPAIVRRIAEEKLGSGDA